MVSDNSRFGLKLGFSFLYTELVTLSLQVPEPDDLTVRVVFSADKTSHVNKKFADLLHKEHYPSEFPYRSKVRSHIFSFDSVMYLKPCLILTNFECFRSFFCSRKLKELIYASLRCLFKSLDQNVANQTNAAYTSCTSIRSSTLDPRE